MRIAKYIADAGICSRRAAEALVTEGRVMVNGETLTSPAFNVPEGAEVHVNGKPIKRAEEQARLWLFHKPIGYITSRKDPEGRRTVFDLLPANMGRVLTIGRLDYNTEGLLLLTNNGDLAHRITHPSMGWERTYRVRVYGRVDVRELADLAQGVTLLDSKGNRVTYGAIKAQVDRQREGKNTWITMTIHEGKNREIRNICKHLGLEVTRLIRTHYGMFELGKLPSGSIREVPEHQVAELLH